MRRIVATTALAFALAVPMLAAPAGAQQQPQTRSQSRSDTATKDLSMVDENDVKGATIRNPQGERIGSVDHVVVDQKTGRVAFAVVGVGGFLGAGAKEVAVPWNRMQPADQPRSYVLNVDKQTLQNAPAVDMKNLQALANTQTQKKISSWWQSNAGAQQAQTPGHPGRSEGGRAPR
jgi:sporulation protein YlmC with PRC-barrel domain